MSPLLPFAEPSAGDSPPGGPIELATGAFHLPGFLALSTQRTLIEYCQQLGREVGFYTPVVRGGRRMSLQMLCLGMHCPHACRAPRLRPI